MDEHLKNNGELVEYTEEIFKELQSRIYSNNGLTHKDLIDKMPDSYENFYQMLVSLKFAGRNIHRIMSDEEELYKATLNQDDTSWTIQPMHEEVKEQTRYFIINTHSAIEQLHKFIAAQFHIDDKYKSNIHSVLLSQEKTNDIGQKLRQAFYTEEGYRTINNLRNALIHNKPEYDVLRYIVEDSDSNTRFQTFALRLHDGEYRGLMPVIDINYESKLETLPINNHEIPLNTVMLSRGYTIQMPGTTINPPNDDVVIKNTHSLNKIIAAQIQGIVPTFVLAPTLVGIYDYINYNIGEIVSESLK